MGGAGHYFLFHGWGSSFLSLSLSFLSGKWELIERTGGKPSLVPGHAGGSEEAGAMCSVHVGCGC